MIVFLVLAANTGSPAPGLAERRTRVSVTIAKGQRVSSETWDPKKNRSQREVIKKQRDGSLVLVRLTEFE